MALTGSALLRRMLFRLLHVWFRWTRALTLGVRAAVLDADGRVFLVRHTYMPGWHLPGGGVEIGEAARDALARELREEAEIELCGEPILHGISWNRHASRRDHVLVYVVREFRLLGRKRADREIAEACFFPLDDLPDGTTAMTRDRLREIATGSAPTLDA